MCPGRLAGALADFLYDVLSCTHDEGGMAKKPITAVDWTELKELGALREVRRLINMHQTVVSVEAPSEGARSLPGNPSNAGQDRVEAQLEQAEAWKQAQVQRKKAIDLGFARVSTMPQL